MVANLFLYTKAYPSITNRIQASVATVANPLAYVASEIDAAVGHPQRTWLFANLPRTNYKFSLDEIDASGNPINNLASYDVVPGAIAGTLTRDDEQIQVGTTLGLAAGTTSFTFDGTGGKPNYIGWEIVLNEIGGRGVLVKNVDYSWDSNTGEFNLLIAGDQLQDLTWYHIHFNNRLTQPGNTGVVNFDFAIVNITNNVTLTAADFGKHLLVEPLGAKLTITLPVIETVPVGRPVSIEVASIGMCSVHIIPTGSDELKFKYGKIIMLPNERITIYKYGRTLSNEWRVKDAFGNYLRVGELVENDNVDNFNVQYLDGSILSSDSYGRLYDEHILQLPLNQVVNFDDWSTGNNKYYFSLANSSNPAFAGLFHIPDRRDLYSRNTKIGVKAGDYLNDLAKYTDMGAQDDANPGDGTATGFAYSAGTAFFRIRTFNLETRPKSYYINKFIVL